MAEDRFDDDGAPPPQDEFDREMDALKMSVEGSPAVNELDGEIVRIIPNSDRIAAIQRHLADTMHKYIMPLEPMYLEVAIALGNIFLASTALWLKECDHVAVFQLNRDAMLNVVERVSARINEIPFSGLADVDMPSERVH